MINDDFNFDTTAGTFTADSADSIVGEVVLLLTAKASGSQLVNGVPVVPGDLFFNPSFGNRSYEITTTNNDALNRQKNSVEHALKPILKNNFVTSIVVDSKFDGDNNQRIITTIVINQIDADPITYTHFVEVG